MRYHSWIFLVSLAAGCAGSGDDGSTDSTATDDNNELDGAQVFADSCAICHGDDGRGISGLAPDLDEVVPGLTLEDIETVITEGTDFMNPVDLFTDEVEAVAEFVLDTHGD